MFCIKCGKPALIDVYCKDCYIETIDKSLFKFRFKMCGKCGKIKVGQNWKNDQNAIIGYIEERLNRYFDDVRVDLNEMIVIVTKNDVDMEFNLNIDYELTMCDTCSKITGGYYEGEIQLRGKNVKKLTKLITGKFDIMENYYSVKVVKTGVDIKFFSSKKALEAIQQLGLSYSISRKLHTQIAGKRKYRLTILIKDDIDNQ